MRLLWPKPTKYWTKKNVLSVAPVNVVVVIKLDEKIRFKKRFKRRTDTNVGEDKTHLENGEDRSFAPREDKLLCPLT